VPLHEYECEKCGKRFEVIQKFSDPKKTRCPQCKGKLKRLISAPGIHFKGSGWYVTDYARSTAGTSSDSNGSSSPGTTEPKSPESKPAAGAETGKAAKPSSRRRTTRAAIARRRRR